MSCSKGGMNVKKVTLSLILLMIVPILVACGTTIEEQKEKAIENVEQAFKAKPKEANKEVQSISFHLPSDSKIEKETANNIFLEHGEEPIILFYNQFEKATSKALYNGLIAAPDKVIGEKSFEDDNRYGFIIINNSNEEDEYIVTVGIGGVKASTKSALKNVAEDAKLLMEIVASTSFIENEEESTDN